MLSVLLEQTERMMQEETKSNLQQLVTDLHYRARVSNDSGIRKIADQLGDLIKKEIRNKNATHRLLLGLGSR